MSFDDFDVNVTPEEHYEEDFSGLCPNCGTDHSDPDDESACAYELGDEPADIDDDLGINPYDGTYDYQNDDDWGF
jgi:hypothetical protein